MANAAITSRWSHNVIDDSKAVEKIVEEMEENDVVGFALQTSGPIISLIQIAVWDNEKGRGIVYIFDMLRLKGLHQLQALLTSTEVLKVSYDCRSVNANLETEFGIRLVNVYDFKVAYTVMKSQRDGQRRESVENVTLNELCGEFGVLRNQLLESLQEELTSHEDFWRKRPLSSGMRDFAMLDTLVLIPLYFQMQPMISEQSSYDRLLAKHLRVDEKEDENKSENESDASTEIKIESKLENKNEKGVSEKAKENKKKQLKKREENSKLTDPNVYDNKISSF